MLEPTVALSDAQMDFFKQEGYLALDALTTPDEAASIRGIYDRLFAEKAGREEGAQFDLAGADGDDEEARLPQIHWPVKYAPELEDTQFRANAYAIARQLLGPETEAQFEHAILKPASMGAETPWHQDEAYWDPALEYNSLSVWIPLQDATVENGCMHFLPRTHEMEVVPHHSIGNDPRVHGLEVDAVDTAAAVACPIPAGGATVHRSRTLHYAGANRSGAPRRAYILLFNTPPAKRAVSRDFYWMREKETARDRRAAQS